jgi:hypothetical protein
VATHPDSRGVGPEGYANDHNAPSSRMRWARLRFQILALFARRIVLATKSQGQFAEGAQFVARTSRPERAAANPNAPQTRAAGGKNIDFMVIADMDRLPWVHARVATSTPKNRRTWLGKARFAPSSSRTTIAASSARRRYRPIMSLRAAAIC